MSEIVAGMLAAAQPLRFYAVRVALRPYRYLCKYEMHPDKMVLYQLLSQRVIGWAVPTFPILNFEF